MLSQLRRNHAGVPMLFKLTTIAISVFAMMAVVACSSSNELSNSNSELANIDIALQYPVERLEDAIWVLTELIDAAGTTAPVHSDEHYSLKFSGPSFFNDARVEGFRRCNALSAKPGGRTSSTLTLTDYSADNEYCGEDKSIDVDQLFDSIFLSEINYKIDNNILTMELASGEGIVFKPGFDERFQNEIVTLIDDSTIRVDFEEYIWVDYDVGFGGGNTFTLYSDMLTDEIKAFVGTMKSTPIYVNHSCPDEITSLNGETFFWISAKRFEGKSYSFGAGITCGLNLIGSRRFLRSDVLALKSMLEKS